MLRRRHLPDERTRDTRKLAHQRQQPAHQLWLARRLGNRQDQQTRRGRSLRHGPVLEQPDGPTTLGCQRFSRVVEPTPLGAVAGTLDEPEHFGRPALCDDSCLRGTCKQRASKFDR